MMEIEKVLKAFSTYRVWMWEIAGAVAVFAVLVYLCRRVVPGRYRYLQRRLPSTVLWGAAAIAVIWFAWEKDIAGKLLRGLGISQTGVPLLHRAGEFLYERAVGMPVNAVLVLFFAFYLLFRAGWISVRRWRQKKRPQTLRKDWTDAYVYSGEALCYVLRPEFVQMRDFYQYLFLSEAVIFGMAKCAAERIAGFEPLFVMAVAICLYTWERFAYYCGRTLEERRECCLGEKDGAKLAQDILEEQKGRRGILYVGEDGEDNAAGAAPDTELEERILAILCSGDYKKRCMGYEWHQMLRNAGAVHTELMEAALLLAERRSVCFPHIFYQDLGPYLFPFIRLELLEGKKLLVVSAVQEGGETLKSWMADELSRRCCTPLFWVAGCGREIGEADIGIVQAGRMEEAVEVYDKNGFFRQVSAVLLINPSGLFPAISIFAVQLLSRLPSGDEKPCYIACDRRGLGMTDWLSRICKTEFISVSSVRASGKGCNVVADMDAFQPGEAVAYVQGREGKERGEGVFPARMRWYGSRFIPVYDAGKPGKGHAFAGEAEPAAEYFADGGGSAAQEYSLCIAEDVGYNVSETLSLYRTRGYGVSLVTVCAPHYMLRDFMISRLRGGEEQRICRILPEHVCSERNLAIAAAHRLIGGGMEWEELENLCGYYGIDVRKGNAWLLGRLNDVYTRGFGLKEVWIAKDLAAQGECTQRVVISSETGRQQMIRWYQENFLTAEMEREDTKEALDVQEAAIGGHIFQYYLPGQLAVLGGRYYRIGEMLFRDGRRKVKLQRVSDDFSRPVYYRQVRRLSLVQEPSFPAECVWQHRDSCVEIRRARISVRTEGYLCSERLNDVRHAKHRRISDIPERVYQRKTYLRIFTEDQDSMWIGILLRECFYTFFPDCWQLLSVAVGEKWMQEELVGHMDILEDAGEKGAVYVIEDSPVDLGILEAIGRRFDTLMSIMHEYVEWGNMDGRDKVREYFGDELLGKLRLAGMK